ncbi:MAG TPA: leucyl aminopeptidase family protein [Gaiellaceae bacterium]|nr:leucyl aminopeptidase family protein [Gaiellaceae bacterium]
MRVLLRPGEPTDLRARLDETLATGETIRDGGEIRVGAGELVDADALRAAAACAARTLRRTGGSIAWRVDAESPLPAEEQVRALVEGTGYGAYDPGLFKRGYAERPELDLVLEAPDRLGNLAERQATVMRHVDGARNLANRPPNDLTPVALAEHARSYADGSLTVESHGREWIVAQMMGAFAAVAAGSGAEPQLIVMRYDPPGAADVTLGLVGKAITFDSGGISLKVALRMQDMKGDMSGGAAVVEATAAIAELGLPVRVLTVVAATENLQDGRAYRPGDILRASNGKTIEIINTDAEGRLVLADALHYARSNGATHVVDFATLTGAMSVALGDLYAGWFCNDDAFAAEIDAAARTSGDLAWRFPLHRRYRRYVDSDFADMKNASEFREAGAVLAAEFLREFAGDGPWAHFDIAGPAYIQRKRPDYALDQGGTGYGVRLAVELAERLASR